MQERIPFVDAHHHLWDLVDFHPSWLTSERADGVSRTYEYDAILKPYLVENLLEDFKGSNVTKSVHVQTGYPPQVDPVSETAWLQGIADVHDFPHGIVASADLSADTIGDELDRHTEFANMRGVRTFVHGDALLEPAFSRGLDALAARDLSYDLSTTWEGMQAARTMAEEHPNLRVILGHAGLPAERSDSYFRDWGEAMHRLAGAPNVAVKVSGLGLGDHSWTEASIRPWVLTAVEAFGVERSMLGTNWPVDKIFSSYQVLVDAYRSIVSEFSVSEQRALLEESTVKHYRLE